MLEPLVVLSAAAATGPGRKIFVKDKKNIILTVASNGVGVGENFTIQAQGSAEELAPDFSAAKSVSNMWDYIQMIKQTDGTPVDGSTGDLFSGSDDVRIYELNVNGLTWMTLNITALTGTLAVTAHAMEYGHGN